MENGTLNNDRIDSDFLRESVSWVCPGVVGRMVSGFGGREDKRRGCTGVVLDGASTVARSGPWTSGEYLVRVIHRRLPPGRDHVGAQTTDGIRAAQAQVQPPENSIRFPVEQAVFFCRSHHHRRAR